LMSFLATLIRVKSARAVPRIGPTMEADVLGNFFGVAGLGIREAVVGAELGGNVMR
jgi:hypothetical protein